MNRTHLPVLFMTALLSLFLFGCETADTGKPLPGFDFRGIEAFQVNVAAVEAQDLTHGEPISDPYVVSPRDTLKQYLQSRYQPRGVRGRMVFEILEASVIEREKEAESKVARWLDVGGFEEYDLTLRVHMRAFDIPGYREMGKIITAQRKLKISEHASVAEREQHQFEALEKAMHDVDVVAQRTIRQDFGL